MSRDSFIALLVRAVEDGIITEAKASELLRSFDTGTIQEFDLPLTVAELSKPIDKQRMSLALIGLLLFLGLKRDSNLPRFQGITQQRLLEGLLTEFRTRARLLATAYGRSESIVIWQQGMNRLIADTMMQARMIGAGRALTSSELALLESPLATQRAFLSRFADKIKVMELSGTPLSIAQIGARAESYAGAARAEFFRAIEGSEDSRGYIVDYIARDDGSTCQPCHAAELEGPYALASGPMPGDVCRGGARCRCVREARYAPSEAARIAA